jgi:hypothetical protein
MLEPEFIITCLNQAVTLYTVEIGFLYTNPMLILDNVIFFNLSVQNITQLKLNITIKGVIQLHAGDPLVKFPRVHTEINCSNDFSVADYFYIVAIGGVVW